ncbi:MAG: DUF1080 domain-containing protein [Acidobacteria bacterium]|nr:DUF1080 domain-containing protein [Acidobacteriota bacterium]
MEILVLCLAAALAQEPRVVTPAASASSAPSDALLLGHSRWTTADGQPNRCRESQGEIVCTSGSGDIYSAEKFGSIQLHLEFNVPVMPGHKSQMKGNSGLYLMERYELQILDSFENPTYVTGMLGALYGQAAPLVNAARKPGEWQSYDVVFHAPQCDAAGKIAKPGTVTALMNGILVQDHVQISEKADQQLKKDGGQGTCPPGRIRLQDHSGFKDAPVTVMKFRNAWVRRLE